MDRFLRVADLPTDLPVAATDVCLLRWSGRTDRKHETTRLDPPQAQIDRQSMSALPSTSDINMLCYRNRIVNLDAQIANSTLDFGMAEQQLNSTQVSGATINQRGFGSA
jgi:hypothetical protein